MDRWLNKGKDSNSIGFSSHIFSGTEGTIKHANEGCEYANEVALFLTKLAKTQRHQPPDIQMSRVCKWVRHWFINITALIGGYFSPHSTVTNFHLFSPPPPFYQLIRLKWNDTQPIELSCSFFCTIRVAKIRYGVNSVGGPKLAKKNWKRRRDNLSIDVICINKNVDEWI